MTAMPWRQPEGGEDTWKENFSIMVSVTCDWCDTPITMRKANYGRARSEGYPVLCPEHHREHRTESERAGYAARKDERNRRRRAAAAAARAKKP